MSSTPIGEFKTEQHVVVLGAGYAGLMAALRLARGRVARRVSLVNDGDAFVERVRLQESVVAPVSARIPSIAAFLARTSIELVRGRAIGLDADRRLVRIDAKGGERTIAFDQLVFALGSGIDVEAIPGAARHAYRLDPGGGPRSAAALRSALRQFAGHAVRVVVIGGAETGVEVASVAKEAWPHAEVTIVSRSRCGDFKGERVERAVRLELEKLGVRLIDGESVTEIRRGEVLTRSGRSIAHDLCVCSGGLRTSGLARDAGLAIDELGRIWVDGSLRSISHPCVLAVGDAARPVGPTGAPYRLSAFTALASGAHAADVIVAQADGASARPFSFSTVGQGVAIGSHGVGFFTYPDDRQALPVIRGRVAGHLRSLFVWLVVATLRLERILPGSFYWPGRRRVSWQQASEAVRGFRASREARAA